jgi:hypothetical protein
MMLENIMVIDCRPPDFLTDAVIAGEIEVWVDGSSVICVKGLLLCDSDDGRIKGMHFQTFFGGEDS